MPAPILLEEMGLSVHDYAALPAKERVARKEKAAQAILDRRKKEEVSISDRLDALEQAVFNRIPNTVEEE